MLLGFILCCFQDDTLKVVNPAYRQLAGQIKSQAARLTRKHIEFSPITLGEQLHEKEIATYESKKAALRETIEDMETRLEQLKRNRKETPRQIALGDLPEQERFRCIAPARKHFLDTIKIIAYRGRNRHGPGHPPSHGPHR